MNTTVVCVLRSGGVYNPDWVWVLNNGVRRWLPSAELVCLTDHQAMLPGVRTIPLKYDWPGWWAKMEMFRPNLGLGDILFLDLDTDIVGDLRDLASAQEVTVLRDFYRTKGIGSGVMFIPEGAREEVWDEWFSNPQGHMARCRNGGDQRFLEGLWKESAARWQDTHPGQIVSYKVDIRNERWMPDGARLVCYHGKPKRHPDGVLR